LKCANRAGGQVHGGSKGEKPDLGVTGRKGPRDRGGPRVYLDRGPSLVCIFSKKKGGRKRPGTSAATRGAGEARLIRKKRNLFEF